MTKKVGFISVDIDFDITNIRQVLGLKFLCLVSMFYCDVENDELGVIENMASLIYLHGFDQK